VTLSLPADIEPYTTDFVQPAIYGLDITLPENLAEEWDRRFEKRAEWFEDMAKADTVVYVGATANLISRLEEHRDSTVRKAILPSLAVDMSLRNVWPRDTPDSAFQGESKVALRLRKHLPETTFVRQA